MCSVRSRNALIDLLGIGEDPPADQRLIVIRQVHEAGEALAQSHRIDERESRPTGRE
jgi:hypothetical protein